MELLVATRSKGKLREIRRILADVPGLVVLDLDEAGVPYDTEEETLEPYETFDENALSKASYFAKRSGKVTVADDSGIEVDALDGAPGVRTKRFAQDGGSVSGTLEGQELDSANNAHLVRRLEHVPAEERTARYVCVAVLVRPGAGEPEPLVVLRGEAPGLIVDDPKGSGGFGYDPFVFDPEVGKTFAEMTPAEKDGRSHRGRTFRALADVLRTDEAAKFLRMEGGAT